MEEKATTQNLGLSQYSGSLAVRGALAFVFGLLALVWTTITLEALIVLFGVFVFIDGLFAFLAASRHDIGGRSRAALFVKAVCGIAVGILTLSWPHLTALLLLFFIAGWALISGLFEMLMSCRLPSGANGKLLLALSGLLSVALGFLLLRYPQTGAMVVIWLIGIYAVIAGVTLLSLGFMLQKMRA